MPLPCHSRSTKKKPGGGRASPLRGQGLKALGRGVLPFPAASAETAKTWPRFPGGCGYPGNHASNAPARIKRAWGRRRPRRSPGHGGCGRGFPLSSLRRELPAQGKPRARLLYHNHRINPPRPFNRLEYPAKALSPEAVMCRANWLVPNCCKRGHRVAERHVGHVNLL